MPLSGEVFAAQMADQFGRQARLGLPRAPLRLLDRWIDDETTYMCARVAAHYGLIALGHTATVRISGVIANP